MKNNVRYLRFAPETAKTVAAQARRNCFLKTCAASTSAKISIAEQACGSNAQLWLIGGGGGGKHVD